MAVLADLLALVKDRPGNPVARALDGAVLDLADRAIQRRFPRPAEGEGGGTIVELVGRLPAHPDRSARVADAAAGGEGLEEGFLALDGPAVVADPAGGEVGCRFW